MKHHFQNPFLRCGLFVLYAVLSATVDAATGTWSTTSGNWNSAGSWSGSLPGSTTLTTNTDVAIFGSSGDGTITVDVNRNLKTLTFSGSSSYDFTGGGLLLTTGGNMTLSNTASQSFSTAITLEGNYAFTNSGTSSTASFTFGAVGAAVASTLTLNGTNTATNIVGSMTNAGGALGVTVAGSGTWNLNGTNNYSGTTVVNSATATLTLSGTQASTTAATTLTTGSLNVNNGGALGGGLLTLTAGTLNNTSGAAIASQTNNPAITLGAITFGTSGSTSSSNLNLGNGAVSYLGTGVPGVTMAGTGTTLTFGGVLTGLSSKTLTVNGAGNTVSFGSLTLNNTTGSNAMVFNGSGNITIAGGVSDGTAPAGGRLTYNGSGTLTLMGAGSYTGLTTVTLGTLNIQNGSALGTTAGGTTVSNGGTLKVQGGITVGAEALSLTGAGATGSTGALQNVSGTNNYGGVVSLTAAATISSDAGTLNLTDTSGIVVGGSSQTVTLTGSGNGTVASAFTSANARLTKTGAGTWTLSGTNAGSYGGTTTVGGGTLQFTKTGALYNGNTANWTAAKITAAGGATLALNVGGAGEFAAADVNTLLANISVAGNATSGLQTGAKLGFDTSNASGGSFTQGNVIADSTGANGGAIGVTKLGTGTLVLDKTNTYTGDTTVVAGKLVINGNVSTSTTIVKANASLGGGGTTGAVIVEAGGLITPGNSAGELTLSDGLTMEGMYQWEMAALSTAGPGTNFDRISITSGDADITGASLGLNLGSFAPSNITFWQNNQVWSGILNNIGSGSLTGTFAAIDNTSWSALGAFSTTYTGNDVNLVWTAVPEPRAALVGGLGLLSLLRRRRYDAFFRS